MQEKVWISGIFDVIFKNHPRHKSNDWLPVGYVYSKPVIGEILEIQRWQKHDDAPSYVVASVFVKLVSITKHYGQGHKRADCETGCQQQEKAIYVPNDGVHIAFSCGGIQRGQRPFWHTTLQRKV